MIARRITIDLVKRFLPIDDYDFYICGPPEFISTLRAALIVWQVPEAQIREESFERRSTQVNASKLPSTLHAPEQSDTSLPRSVLFVESGTTASWNVVHEALLELAEANGVKAQFRCRTGVCGTCAMKLLSDSVSYPAPRLSPR